VVFMEASWVSSWVVLENGWAPVWILQGGADGRRKGGYVCLLVLRTVAVRWIPGTVSTAETRVAVAEQSSDHAASRALGVVTQRR
jgi:hypothetical protein